MPTQLLLRLSILLCGLILLAFAVAISIRSNLGTSPISSLPYVYSFILPLSVGTLTILMHVLMIALQKLLLKDNFRWTRWLQLPVGLIFGLGIDLMLWLTQSWSPITYLQQILYCLSSCAITAIAVCMIIKANLIFLAGEGLYQAFSLRFNWNFGSCKLYGDIALISIAVLSSLFVFHQILGVREGTIIAAVLVGILVKMMLPRLAFIEFK
ncbi:DUF6198 family protein [Acinetobacter sp. B51(2017)]|uniref:YczE/YyaS/YitT family protein n=1 Tax=Acinetobacter sp. B51(2017) TaxID=2060938 RepID=UPI000F091790|nr:DUF6198 family protein [Acinetobacter sp. B51(2017)]